MSAAGINQAYEMLSDHKLTTLEGLVILHLGVRDVPAARTMRGIARCLGKDPRTIARILSALCARGLLCKTSGLWSLPYGQQSASADVEQVPTVEQGAGPSPAPLVEEGVGVSPTGGRVPRLLRRRSLARPRKENDKKRRAGRVASSFSPEDLGRVARSEILSGRSAFVGGQVLKPGSPEFEALAQILRDTPPNGGAVASQASGRLTAGPSVV